MAGTRKWWQITASIWSQRDKLGERKIAHTEQEFFPAALEIQEAPPSPTSRIVSWCLITLFAIAVIWTCIGEVDVVAIAEGRIIPSGQIKQIQPLEKGVVKSLYVEEGQIVKKGQPLIELDQTLTNADQERLAKELSFVEAGINRQKAYTKMLESPQQDINYAKFITKASELNVTESQQLALLWQEWQSFQSKRDALRAEMQERIAERQASRERIAQLEATIPLVTKRAEAIKSLLKKDLAAEATWLELEEQRIQQAHALSAEKAMQLQMNAGIRRVEKQLEALQAEVATQVLTALSEQQRQKQSLQQELSKAKDLNSRQILYAPISGKVQQLAVHTIGGVVTPAQPLMFIVPTDAQLEVEAWLENKDIGFVEIGQSAEIKINTFPFTKYGVIEGNVKDMTQDAVADEEMKFRYKMKASMNQSTIQVDNRQVGLIPGMKVSVEIKTGKRRLIEFILSPLIKYKSESGRER
ncbi:HlyD family type I secretion periplasmic adaptor subunit [Porticoccaceae bacterium LTM1]|nr:HlyD family type I secretion periplasmic adaptor subunit [Porticoccaceae bacterium LTM1]